MVKSSTPPIRTVFADLTDEELLAAKAQGELALTEYQNSLKKIEELCSQHDPIEILARLAYQVIVHQAAFGSANYDPLIQAHQLDFVQAVALTVKDHQATDPKKVGELIDEMMEQIGRSSRSFREKDYSSFSTDDEKNRFDELLQRIRATTQTVRGARHAFQTRAYLQDLAVKMDASFQKQLGFTLTQFLSLIDDTALKFEERLSALRQGARRWMLEQNSKRCLELFLEDNPQCCDHPYLSELSNDGKDKPERVNGALWAIFEQSLKTVFLVLSARDSENLSVSKLHEAIISLSFGVGDLDRSHIDRFYLDNPIWLKPFVRAADKHVYLFSAQTTFSNLIELVEELVARDAKLSASVEKFKAKWLEAKVAKIVGDAFPSGDVHANVKWTDENGDPGETDCLLAIDKTFGLFEAKSGRVTQPAKRGGSERLKREFSKLLIEPSRQSARFEKLLRSKLSKLSVRTDTKTIEIAAVEIREVIRVNVLFYTVGPLSACSNRLKQSGFIDPLEPMAPSMSVFELETILDILPDQISRMHYLRRRCDLEQNSFFEADEMDMTAFYLENSFCLNQLEFDKWGFNIYGWSDRIARFYDHEGRTKKFSQKLKQTPLWRRLLTAIEEHQHTGWTRFGQRLSCVPYADQWALQRARDAAFKKARKVKVGQAVHTGSYSPNENHRMAIGICVGNGVSEFGIYDHCQGAANTVMELANVRDALVVYWDIKEPDLPYKFIATFKYQSG